MIKTGRPAQQHRPAQPTGLMNMGTQHYSGMSIQLHLVFILLYGTVLI
jgi:hypothetical protein